MTDWVSTLREMERRSRQATKDASLLIETETITEAFSPKSSESPAISGSPLDPLDRERIVEERLAELSDTLSVRYRQVCRDLRDKSRLAWTSDAHELRDILSNILRTLAPTEDVEAQPWYKRVEGTDGPTQAQRAKYILLQNHAGNAANDVGNQIELINELVSKIVRATYTRGSKLAHAGEATHRDCVGLLLHFDALMFSLLNVANDSNS